MGRGLREVSWGRRKQSELMLDPVMEEDAP